MSAPMKTPDYPPMQIVAVVGSIIATAVAFGWDLTPEQRDALDNLVKVLAAAGAFDAVIRVGRSVGKRH